MAPLAHDAGRQFIEQLVDEAGDVVDATDVAILAAHPDDETLGCGAQIPRLRRATVVTITDGAPRDLFDARRLGLSSTAQYAALRAAELAFALAVSHSDVDVLRLDVPDQHAAFELAPLARRVAEELDRRAIRILLTHAYEGGHPDHDATAFVAHACAAILATEGHRVAIVEMPLYRASSDGGIARQEFVHMADHPERRIALSPGRREAKRRMLDAYSSQEVVLRDFDVAHECFRVAPPYSFDAPPNGGAVLYERYPWGMTAGRWLSLVQAAQRELGISLPCP